MKTDKFNEIKDGIISRAREAFACRKEFRRAYKSETLAELMQVVKDNFEWAYENKVITSSFIKEYEEEFAKNNIWLNRDVINGHLLCVDSSVKACGHSLVVARGNSSVEAYGDTSVEVHSDSSVVAYDNSSVKAYHCSSVAAFDNSSVEVFGDSSVVAYDNSSVEAHNSSSVKAYGKSSVKAFDHSIVITAFPGVECLVFDNAIHRALPENKIYYASDSTEFVKQ